MAYFFVLFSTYYHKKGCNFQLLTPAPLKGPAHNPSPTRGPLVGGDPEGGPPCGGGAKR